MIKAIIFDFGNVIYKFDNDIFIRTISNFTDKGPDTLKKIIYEDTNLSHQFETGQISSDSFYREVKKIGGLDISKEDFVTAFTNIFSPIPQTIDLIRRLNSRYRLALLTDTNEWDYERIIKTSPIFSLFDVVILSYKFKIKKPDQKIFFITLDRLRLKPGECLYIDDKREFIRAASLININGIHYQTADLLIHKLRSNYKINI